MSMGGQVGKKKINNTFSSPSERRGAAQLPFRRVTNDPNKTQNRKYGGGGGGNEWKIE